MEEDSAAYWAGFKAEARRCHCHLCTVRRAEEVLEKAELMHSKTPIVEIMAKQAAAWRDASGGLHVNRIPEALPNSITGGQCFTTPRQDPAPRCIFLDMDGVLADFEGEITRRWIAGPHDYIQRPKATWTEAELARDQKVRVAMAQPDFWPSLEPMPGAMELLTVARHLVGHDRLFILTATPATKPEVASENKRAWAAKHLGFPTDQIITCPRAAKSVYAGQGKILVDDLMTNCFEWETAGGTAFVHTDAASSIKGLLELFA